MARKHIAGVWLGCLMTVVYACSAPLPTTCSPLEWDVSWYPAGYRFAFTIVHDADNAYSTRLAPLFEVFDELGLKITVTLFAFWPDWAKNGAVWSKWRAAGNVETAFRAPQAVPLVDQTERSFYRTLAARGHEIGLHSASESSDTRAATIRAFEYFKEVFGYYPAVYVEHSSRNNREAQINEGSDARSIYYNTDLLNRYGPWVWVDGPGALPDPRRKFYDLVASNGTPFSQWAAGRFGISKAFIRSGRWDKADGSGFLEVYSTQNLDALERDRGLALVYTHLDSKWLDPETRRMRGAIEDRLRYLAAKKGWFAPAGTILDRVQAVSAVRLICTANSIKITNGSARRIEQLEVASHGRMPKAIVVDSIGPSETKSIVLPE